MPIDAKRTLKKLRGAETKKGKTTLYLDQDVYRQFKKACSEMPPSRVVEQLMRDFVESAKPKK